MITQPAGQSAGCVIKGLARIYVKTAYTMVVALHELTLGFVICVYRLLTYFEYAPRTLNLISRLQLIHYELFTLCKLV